MTQLLICNLNSFLGWGVIQKCPPYVEVKERQKKGVDHSRFVACRANKEGKSHTRFHEWAQNKLIPISTTRILKSSYRGFDGVQSLKQFLVEDGGQNLLSRGRGESEEASIAGPAPRLTSRHTLSMTSSNYNGGHPMNN